jgi:hypothetical protein
MMLLESENRVAIRNPSEKSIKAQIVALRSYGPSSFATISDDNGNYIQIAGGGVTCVLEKREGTTAKQYRAFKNEKSKVFTSETELVFGGGTLKVQPDEWFTNEEVIDIIIEFMRGVESAHKNWRELTLTPLAM